MKIVFFGTPEFAAHCLDTLVQAKENIVAVVTAPDKPAGRGMQLNESAVKKLAIEKGIKILQPEKLKSPEFISELQGLGADLFIVVAFRMLPEAVWNMPPKGTFNLHASLLPQYRGAAPINWAIINGEKETGVTTFFLQHEIDTGNIILQEKVAIKPEDNVGVLYENLMRVGAELILKTVKLIGLNQVTPIAQETVINGELKHAPKIFKETCKIDFSKSAEEIHNLIRGLSPYPAAFFELNTGAGIVNVKVFMSSFTLAEHQKNIGAIETDSKKFLRIYCKNGFIEILDSQFPGKKRMLIEEFLRGAKNPDAFKIS